MKYSLLILFLFIAGCVGQLVIKDYPINEPVYEMFGKVPERNFYYPFELADSLELIFEGSTKGSLHNGTVAIQGKYVYATDLAGNLFAFDIDTLSTAGADKNDGEIAVSPMIFNGLLYYIITEDEEEYSNFVIYDIKKGERRKERRVESRVGNEMLRVNDKIIFVTDMGTVYCYDSYGNEIWKIKLDVDVYTSPASDRDFIYISANSGEIISIGINNGNVRFRTSLSDRTESAISINGNRGFVGDEKGILYSFNIENGEMIWKFNTGSKIKSTPVFNEKYIYIGNLSGNLFCLDKSNGEEIWSAATGGLFNATPALFYNYLVQPDAGERILFVDPLDGEILKTWQYETRVKMTPVYFNDFLFVGRDRGELLVYRPYHLVKNDD